MAHCSEHSRAAFVRRGLAEAGRGLPAIEPGMPMPAGTGLDRRTFVARGRRPRPGRLRRRGSAAGAVRRGDRGCSGCSAATERARLGVPRWWRRCALAARADRRSALPPAAAAPGAARRSRPGVRRGRHADLASVAGTAGRAARRGEGERDARHRLRPPQPVALHLPALLGGRSRGRAADDGMARPLPRPGRQHEQPAPGPLARLEPAALARHGEDAGRRRRRAGQLRLLGARRLGRGVRADGRDDRQARRDPDPARSRARGRSRCSAPVGPALRAAHSVPPEGRQEAAARPGGLPGE